MFGALLGLILPSPIDKAKAAVQPNPYAPQLTAQWSVAIGQQVERGISGGLTGLTGSEADYQLEQMSGRSDIGAWLHQFIPSAAAPPSRYTPRLPDQVEGRGTGYNTGAYNKGTVRLRDREAWGGSARTIHKAQNVINGILLNPLDRAPLPRDAAAAYARSNPDELRLEDQYGSDS